MTAETVTLLRHPIKPPRCYSCLGPSHKHTASPFNRNGNAGREFYKCHRCDRFLVFNDSRGNLSNNPNCYCGASSKMQVSGLEKETPRALHFVCRLGGCGFYAPALKSGRPVILDQEARDRFISLGFV